MGKKLIIKGANFFINAIGKSEIDIAGVIPLTRTYIRSWATAPTSLNTRIGTTQAFDLAEYILQGYSKIAIYPKEGISWSCFVSTVNGTDLGTNPVCNSTNSASLYEGEINFPLTVWHDGNSEILLNSYRYLQIGLKQDVPFENVDYFADSFMAIVLR